MKTKNLACLYIILLCTLLVSCAAPEVLDGTVWERNLMGQGARLEFGPDTAECTLLMAGADDIDYGSFSYDYADGEIYFYYQGSTSVISSGTVTGTTMELESGSGGLWGKFTRKK